MSDLRYGFMHYITDGTGKPFYARNEVDLFGKPVHGEALVCGLGQFNFYINGQKVGDHVLDPAWTDYRKLANYVRFDITPYLKEGTNIFAVEVGNGWYLADRELGYFFHFPPFMPKNPNGYKPFDDTLVLGLHAEIHLADDTVVFENAGSSWLTAPHEIVHTNCFGSEEADGRRQVPGWNTENTDMKYWTPAKIADSGDRLNAVLAEQTIPPVKVIRTYEGKYLHTAGGRAIYDFGQNCSGMLSFEVKGKRGDVVTAYPAEKLAADGDVDQMAKNWLPIDVKEVYTIGQDDTWETFSMTFTYFGGRYIAVDTAPENLRNVQLHAISSAEEPAGTFECDDARLMQIYSLIEKSVEANMVGVHTDCPTIERFAWQEENHLMAPAIMYMKAVKPHWEKFLKDTRLAQHTKDDWFYDMDGGRYYPGDGLIPAQAPCYIPNVLPVPGMGDFYNVIGWGSSIILGTWWHYQFYGDRKIIEDNYEAGKKYLAFLKTQVNADGFINNGLGDWGNPDHAYAKENVETCFLYADADTLRKFAGILGKTEDERAFAAYAEEVRKNYNEKLLVYDEKAGRYCYRVFGAEGITMTQASEAMPLFWGMVPEERKKDVAAALRAVLEKDGCLRAGEVGQPYIIQTMNAYGMNDLLSAFIVKPVHPSYYAFVLAGETTLGEYWEENPRSHCHDMMGHIAEWYYNGMAGIIPEEPGFRKVLVRPYLPESVHHLKASYNSASGLIRVELTRKESGEILLDVQAADGIRVRVDRSRLDGEH